MPGKHLISLHTQTLTSQMEVLHNKQTKVDAMQTTRDLNGVSEYAEVYWVK